MKTMKNFLIYALLVAAIVLLTDVVANFILGANNKSTNNSVVENINSKDINNSNV